LGGGGGGGGGGDNDCGDFGVVSRPAKDIPRTSIPPKDVVKKPNVRQATIGSLARVVKLSEVECIAVRLRKVHVRQIPRLHHRNQKPVRFTCACARREGAPSIKKRLVGRGDGWWYKED
jgi:hypothetical protein